LREQILEAAEDLLISTGDEALVSVRAIADRVGCTAPAIYLHFEDKDDLFREVCERRFEELNRFFDAVEGDGDEPLLQLRNLGLAYVRFAMENPEHYRVLMMTKMHHTHRDTDFAIDAAPEHEGDRAFLRLVRAVQRAIDSGDLRQEDPMKIAVTLWASIHGLVSLLIHAPNFPWPDRDELIDFVLDAQMVGLLA
jgi:AcrR family transcriptional regulator